MSREFCIANSMLLSPRRQWYHLKRMSLASAIIGADGIVLASDSKETEGSGNYQSRNAHKIDRVTDSIWMACVSDYVEFTNRLIDDFIYYTNKQALEEHIQLDIRLVGKYFETYANDEYTKLRQDPQKKVLCQPLEGGVYVIIAGYTKDTIPKPKLRIATIRKEIDLPPFTVGGNDYFWASGRLQTALYWLYKIDRIKSLNSIDSKTLMMLTILIFIETIKETAFVGTPLDIVIIRPMGVADKITISEVELKKIQNELDTVIGEEIILGKLTKLADNQDLLVK
jgi:20S proteasome alpha/beta subunit